MSDKEDIVTRLVDRTLDVLFAKYPARTGLGVILGAVLSFLVQLFEPSLKSIDAINFAGAPFWGWLAIGILIMHAPTIAALAKQKPVGDDMVDQALDLIERGNFSQAEKRQQFRSLIAQVSSNIALKKSTQREISDVENSLQGSDKN